MQTALRLLATLSVAFLGIVVMKIAAELILEGIGKAHSWRYAISKHGLVWFCFLLWGALLASLSAGLWLRIRYAAWTVLLLFVPQVFFWVDTALTEGITNLLAAGITALTFAVLESTRQIASAHQKKPHLKQSGEQPNQEGIPSR